MVTVELSNSSYKSNNDLSKVIEKVSKFLEIS
jgi:hypothetical protein